MVDDLDPQRQQALADKIPNVLESAAMELISTRQDEEMNDADRLLRGEALFIGPKRLSAYARVQQRRPPLGGLRPRRKDPVWAVPDRSRFLRAGSNRACLTCRT